MYLITVRDSDGNILLTREVDEPPNKLMFDELAQEIRQDCYIDVCRLPNSSPSSHHMGFEDAVEFELIRGEEHPELAELESEEAYFDELNKLDDEETDD